MGTLKGVGRIYQQTFIDTYSKVACAKLYTTKTPITAADLLNDRVLPLFEEHGLPMLRMLTDRGAEYCGRADRHDYELYLARVISTTCPPAACAKPLTHIKATDAGVAKLSITIRPGMRRGWSMSMNVNRGSP